jgi:ribonuclease P protein component
VNTAARDEGFPKSLRLTRRSDFLRVQGSGIKVSTEPLLALALQNSLGKTRVGITVSKKVGNAVIRNRIRRRLREIFRKEGRGFPGGLDLVLIATSRAKQTDFGGLGRACQALAQRLRERFPCES